MIPIKDKYNHLKVAGSILTTGEETIQEYLTLVPSYG